VSDLEQSMSGIGALVEPVRRELYRYVCAQPAPVGRDEAADAIGIARHQAKFHLDRLEAEGLLEADYARLSGRSGPGAGRTAKRYRRSPREIAVSLPDREYELAGHLMAEAIADSSRRGTPVLEALYRAAAERGRAVGTAAAGRAGQPTLDALEVAVRTLDESGYEPRREGERAIMANCPFHALAQSHTELVCRMNHAFVAGLVEGVAPRRLDAHLDPGPDRCCVVLTRAAAAEAAQRESDANSSSSRS
jgi:predicted ArsR family transcriptional regulator